MPHNDALARRAGLALIVFAMVLATLEFGGIGFLNPNKFKLILATGGGLVAGNEIKRAVTITVGEKRTTHRRSGSADDTTKETSDD